MTSNTFFWHDYETFGRVPRRDLPAQFAGVRTDEALNEIGEPLMLYCRPSPDYLPDPESCLLTGILPQHCLEHGVAERDFAARIEAELGRPGTVGVGYNSIRFDDEVTRHLLWRSLTDPYAREYKNDCGRWDLLDVVRCTWSLRPEGIEWPRHEDGRPSFKLEDLTRANGLAHEAAHDALSDVRATVAMARLIRERQPRLWDFALKLRRKDAVWQEIGQQRPFLHISGMYGVERGCMSVVWPLAMHPTNRNELIVWDLSESPEELFTLNAESIRSRLFVRAEDLPEGTTRLPIKTIHVNKSPMVIGNLKTLQPAVAERWQIDLARCQHHADLCRDGSHVMDGLWPDVFARPASSAPADVDQDLYGGFLNPNDRARLDRLRRLSGEELALAPLGFDDPRLEELVFRYRARNYPETLNEGDAERWEEHRRARLHEGVGGGLTLSAFFERIDALGETADDDAADLLGALYDYAEGIAPSA